MDVAEYKDIELEVSTMSVQFPTVLDNSNLSQIINMTFPKQECKWSGLNTVLTLLIFATFILNILSSIVLFRVPLVTVRGRSNPVYLCIRFLNVCDVLQAFFLVLMPAFASPECNWLGGQISCSIMGFIVLFFLLVSPLITILMAFDRVIALYRPFKYRSHLGLKMLKFLLPSACILVLVTTILPIFGVGEYHVVKGRRFCLLDTITDNRLHRSYVIGVHSVFLMALLFMLSCTIAFQTKLLSMSFTKKHKESKSKSRKKISSRRTRNATLTTMAVCSIFIVCYLPYVIRVLIEASTLQKSPSWITWMTFGLAFLQPLLNPLVYIGTNPRYRQELQALVKNIKVSDWDTSSESGTTQGVFRAGLHEFRKRISSGGGRGSKRGSKRRFEGHNSTGALPDFMRNGTSKRESWIRRSGHPVFQFEQTNINDVISKNKDSSSLDLHLHGDGKERCREPSSSSGVRSYDSVEKMPLTPQTVSSPCARFSQSSTAYMESTKYGRALRDNDDVFEPEIRERCNTFSERKNCNTAKLSGAQSTSIPNTLNETRDLNTFERDKMVNTAISSPQKHATDNVGSMEEIQHSGSDVQINSQVPEILFSPDSNARLSCNSDNNHSESPRVKRVNGSYKKALEMTPQYFPSKKPFKRDSGVGES